MTALPKALSQCAPTSRHSIETAFQRLVEELEFMIEHASLLDHQIGQLALQDSEIDPRALQGADRLRQELEGLHEFAHRLIGTLGPDGLCSPDLAATSLKVRAQALRLRGLPPEAGSDDLW